MPNGTYAVIVGTGFYGTVGVSLEEHKVETNVVVTNTWGTNTVFYQCWLTKTVWTNAVYASSNIEHRVSYDIYAVPASIASNNSWDDEGTGWTNSVWSRDNTDGWGWDTNASASLGGDIATPPDDMAEPAVANQTYASGWRVTDSRGVLNWRFLYATNNLE